jgi:GntR family transcriptional regulator
MRRIDPTSERPLYRQLADAIRDTITSQEWQPGRNLPSEAALGHEYETSLATVRKALAVLRAEGLVEPVRGRPWRVREIGEPAVLPLRPGDKVRARIASRADHERHGVPEGVPVLAVLRPGEAERVYRADEHDAEVAGED